MLSHLVRWSSKKSQTFVQSVAVDLSRETQERIGQVFGILSSETDARSGDALIATIEDALVRGINEGLLRKDANADKIFEGAVARVNAALVKLIEDRNLPVDPATTRSILVLQKDADVTIATWGDPHVLLFHVSDKRPSGRVYDLLSDTRADGDAATRSSSRCYSNIISGVVGDRDRLLLSTHDISQWVPPEALKQVVLSGTPDAASVALQEKLMQAAPKLAVALLLVDAEHGDAATDQHAQPSAPQHSMDGLLHTADRTSDIMTPPVIGSILRRIGSTASEGLQKAKSAMSAMTADRGDSEEALSGEPPIDAPAGSILEDLIVPAAQEPEQASPTAPATEPVPPAATPAQTSQRNLLAKLRDITDTTITDTVHNFNSLPKKRRLLLLSSLALVLILNHGVAFAEWNRRSAAADAATGKIIASIEQKIDSAESSIIYRDEARARALLEEASVLIGTLPDRPDTIATEKTRLNGIIAEKFDALRNAIVLPAAQVIASVSGENGEADLRRLVLRQQVAWTTAADGSIYKTDIRNGTTSSVGAVTGEPTVLFPASNGLIAGTVTGLTRFNYASSGSTVLTLALGDNEVAITDTDTYGNRLYILDAVHNRILRHDAATGGYTAPVFYLKDGTDLSSGVSMAIDGAVYVAMRDGSVARFLSGAHEDFAVQKVDPPVTAPVKIRTTETSDRLYLLDASSPARIITFSKRTGALLAQYVSEELDGATDFAIDETAKVIYVVRGNSVLSFAIPETR